MKREQYELKRKKLTDKYKSDLSKLDALFNDRNVTFKKGDKVRLVSKDQVSIKTKNWIQKERSNPKIGDIFTVLECKENSEFVDLEELLLSHPKSKFEKL